jgi:hypothetical protein
MKWQDYQLENTILKTNEAITLLKIEKGIVEISKDTLAIPIKLGGERKGYIFHGHGKLVLDTIVETNKGAVGKPVEKEISEPFLMLGNSEIEQHFSVANKDDLKMMNYESENEFMTKAEKLFDRFFGRQIVHDCHCCGSDDGLIFAFSNEVGKPDVLVAKGSKLVYKAKDRVFVSNKSKVVLKTPNEVIVSNNHRSFVINR